MNLLIFNTIASKISSTRFRPFSCDTVTSFWTLKKYLKTPARFTKEHGPLDKQIAAMPCELRKRNAPPVQTTVQPVKKKTKTTATGTASVKPSRNKVKDLPISTTPAVKKPRAKSVISSSSCKIAVGDTIALAGFGGQIETQDGIKTTLQKLVDESKGGVVLFTYPKASTPGCTTQACLFRDQYASLSATGLSIYGLSKDSTKANTNFKTKQKLPYPLLCDPRATLITAIGLKKAPSSTTRGVFVINKSGKVLAAQAGNPAATVDVVKNLVKSGDCSKNQHGVGTAGDSTENENSDEEAVGKMVNKTDYDDDDESERSQKL